MKIGDNGFEVLRGYTDRYDTSLFFESTVTIDIIQCTSPPESEIVTYILKLSQFGSVFNKLRQIRT